MPRRKPPSGEIVRPGCRTLEIDSTNEALLFDPKTWTAKRRAERQKSIDAMRQMGRVSMVEVAPDVFRTPNRAERRRAGVRRVAG